ncbi:hypothetical protein GGI26_003969 [Coemansia sp. RSA 1358]|nr:hypothetical protein GGI26_003969 [Coemansia sp. RSA 1358]
MTRFHTQAQLGFPHTLHKANTKNKSKSRSSWGAKTSNPIEDTTDTRGKLKKIERSLWRKQFVLDNYDIPGKYKKYFTGKLRKRETNQLKRQLDPTSNDAPSDLIRVSARTVTLDEDTQVHKMRLMRSQILRILERHLSSDQLPVRQLSLQYWEILDVLVSFNLKTAICCFRVTAKESTEGIKPFQVRRIIQESSEYLNLIVNQELSKGAGKGIGAPRSVRVRFTNGAATSKLMEKMQMEVDGSESSEFSEQQ